MSKSLLVAAPFGKASFSDSLPDLQAALKDFQKTVERHIPKTAVVGASRRATAGSRCAWACADAARPRPCYLA